MDLFAPLRSGADLRGRIESVHPETADAATIVIRPGADWAGHVPGQYLRIGIDVDGVRQWRAYSLTHGPRRDGRISITVKAVPDGLVSNHLVHECAARHAGPPRAGGRRVRPPARRRQVPHGHRRLRHHAGHRHAAQPLPQHRRGRAPPGPQRRPRHRRGPRRPQPPATRSSSATSRRSTPPARSASSRGTTTSTASSTSTTSPTWCPTWPSAPRSPAARPACSTRSAPTTRRPASP